MSKMPKDWEIRELSEVAIIQTGLAKGKKNLKDVVSLPYLRVANVQDGYFNLSEVKTVEVAKSEVERYRLKPNDVLLTEGGDFDKLGRGHIWQGQIDPCLHQNHIFVVRPNPQILKPEFLNALSASPYGRKYFLSCSKQSTNLASVNSTQLKQFPVLLPSLCEQEAITRVIGSWDRAIEKLQSLIATKTQYKRGLMQQLLTGRKRFPEFAGQAWQRHRIATLFEEVRRYELWNEEARYDLVSIRRRCGGLFYRGAQLGKEIKVKKLKSIATGDFLISKRQVVHGAWGMVTPEFDGMKVSDEYDCLIVKDPQVLDIEFFNWLSQLPFMQRYAYLACNGVHIEKLIFDYEDFSKEVISLPPTLAEQQKIAAVLNACDREIRLLNEQLAALKTQKQGLMQKLLTGQVRVRVEEEPSKGSTLT